MTKEATLDGVVWVCHGCSLWSIKAELNHTQGCSGVANPFRVDDLPHGVV